MKVARVAQRGQLLILLAAWLFFGGGASSALIAYDRPASEVRKAVKMAVTDETRSKEIRSDIDQWTSNQEYRDKRVNADREELLKAMRRQETQRADVEGLTTKLDDKLLEMDRLFLDMRFRVKERVSRAEWAVIVPPGG